MEINFDIFISEAKMLYPKEFAQAKEEHNTLLCLRKNDQRYRWLRAQVYGMRKYDSYRPASFVFPSSMTLPTLTNIMQGSVAQQLDNSIDAQIKKENYI